MYLMSRLETQQPRRSLGICANVYIKQLLQEIINRHKTELHKTKSWFRHLYTRLFCYQDRKWIASIQQLPHSYSSQSDGSTSVSVRDVNFFFLSRLAACLWRSSLCSCVLLLCLFFARSLSHRPPPLSHDCRSHSFISFSTAALVRLVNRRFRAYSTFNKRKTVHQYPAFKC